MNSQCPTSIMNTILPLPFQPLKSAQTIWWCLLRDKRGSVLHAAATSPIWLVLAEIKTQCTHATNSFASPSHTDLLFVWFAETG